MLGSPHSGYFSLDRGSAEPGQEKEFVRLTARKAAGAIGECDADIVHFLRKRSDSPVRSRRSVQMSSRMAPLYGGGYTFHLGV